MQSHKMFEEMIKDINLKLFDLVREVMARKSRIQVVIRTIVRFLHCSSLQLREAARLEPSPEYMRKAWRLVYMAGTEETQRALRAGKLTGLCPFVNMGLIQT